MRHLDGDWSGRLRRHGLGGCPVARVRGPAIGAFLVLFVSEVLGHLLVEGGLQHGLGELPQQTVAAGQVKPLLLGLPDYL